MPGAGVMIGRGDSAGGWGNDRKGPMIPRGDSAGVWSTAEYFSSLE